MSSFDLIWRLIVLLLLSYNKDNDQDNQDQKQSKLGGPTATQFFVFYIKKEDMNRHSHLRTQLFVHSISCQQFNYNKCFYICQLNINSQRKKTLGELRSKRAKPLIENNKNVVNKFQGRYYKLDIEIKKRKIGVFIDISIVCWFLFSVNYLTLKDVSYLTLFFYNIFCIS